MVAWNERMKFLADWAAQSTGGAVADQNVVLTYSADSIAALKAGSQRFHRGEITHIIAIKGHLGPFALSGGLRAWHMRGAPDWGSAVN